MSRRTKNMNPCQASEIHEVDLRPAQGNNGNPLNLRERTDAPVQSRHSRRQNNQDQHEIEQNRNDSAAVGADDGNHHSTHSNRDCIEQTRSSPSNNIQIGDFFNEIDLDFLTSNAEQQVTRSAQNSIMLNSKSSNSSKVSGSFIELTSEESRCSNSSSSTPTSNGNQQSDFSKTATVPPIKITSYQVSSSIPKSSDQLNSPKSSDLVAQKDPMKVLYKDHWLRRIYLIKKIKTEGRIPLSIIIKHILVNRI
ncbi:MAG: hypothetical protein EZS28_005923 [Streblomastix strix]|uniref:Uncharacterized protein n=1 Tax=Streblomastix strix TaxID=222440 RepID=A0A5J4WUA3_9EUKA|nr:MAG: hypothetical protein EZS28_005923 [Streblomastix strix]